MTAALALSTLLAGGAMSIYDFHVKANDGTDVSLSRYRGKVLLVVNTASRCGYTPQYRGLEELYEAYRARGLEILAFPSNDFGGQEPGTNEEIRSFCDLRYHTTFPLFAKVAVKGAKADPLYQFLTSLPENGGEVTWNFNKFVVDAQGHVVAHLDSAVEPGSPEVRAILERLLPAR